MLSAYLQNNSIGTNINRGTCYCADTYASVCTMVADKCSIGGYDLTFICYNGDISKMSFIVENWFEKLK